MATRKINRKDGPKEINLKNFYSFTELERKAHIDALQLLEFNELSQVDLGVVYFWYQNWKMEDWPNRTKNFITIQEVDASIRVENSIKKMMYTQTENTSTLSDEFDELIKVIPKYTKSDIKEILQTIFAEDYPKWEFDLRSTTPTKFVDATSNIFVYNEFEVELIHEYTRR